MCKAYGGEPTIDLFRGFLNIFLAGDWLTFAKMLEAKVSAILFKPISRLEDWKGRFLYIKDTIVPTEYLELLSEANKLDKKSFKYKTPPSISETLMYQRLARHPADVQIFPDLILYLAGLKSSWKHSALQRAIYVGGNEMAFRNFMFVDDDEEMSFLLKEPSNEFGAGLLGCAHQLQEGFGMCTCFNTRAYSQEAPVLYFACFAKRVFCWLSTVRRSRILFVGMERGFLSQKGSEVGRGVKENGSNSSYLKVVNDGVVPSVNVDYGNTRVEIKWQASFGPFDRYMEKEKLYSLEDTTVLGSFPPLPTHVTNLAGNAPGKSSYANVTGKPRGKKFNIRTFFTSRGNGIDVVVPVESIRAISEQFANTTYSFLLGKSSYVRVMIELRTDVELKDNIVVVMPKITREGHYICNVLVEYEWKPPRCASCKVFGHIHEECPKNTGVGENKTIKKHSQTSRVLNLVDNDEELSTNRGTTNLVNNGATSSGSSFMNVDNSSTGTTPIIDKIGKFEELLTSGQAILVDETGKTRSFHRDLSSL
ncbi:hypothetical protein Tco_0787188 [Tanacetum coccineum]